MADESTTSSMAGIGPAQVSNFLISEPRDEAVLAPLVHWQDAMGSLSVAQGAITSTLSATAITNGATEADAASSWSQVTTAAATFTPAIKAAFVIVSMQRMRSSPVDVVGSVRGIVERGLVNKLESDIGALGGGFSNTAGTSGAALAIAALQVAATKFRGGAKRGSDVGVYCLHSKSFGDAESDALTSQSSFFTHPELASILTSASGAQRTAYRGAIFGYPILVTDNMESTGGNYENMLVRPFVPARAELGAAIGGGWDGFGEIETASQMPNRSTAMSVAGTVRYAVGEELDVNGVLIYGGN